MTHRTLKTLLASLTLTLIYIGSTSRVVANCFPSSSTIVKEEVSYVPNHFTNADDLRSNSGRVHLMGWLYYRIPPGETTLKNAPVVIYNHGHDQYRGEPCEIARYFVNQGFVVFAPLRRGHVSIDGQIRSTGVYTDDYVAACMDSGNCAPCNGNDLADCTANAYTVDYLRQQYIDVRDQLRWVRDHPPLGTGTTGKMADPKRIAIMGHSFGGALMVFANARLDGIHNVAIDISGAELSWGPDEPFWKSELKPAARDANRPIYFLQPKNGVSLEPTRVLFGASVAERFRAQASIFPPAPWDDVCRPDRPHRSQCWDEENDQLIPEAVQAHSTFIGDKTQVELWGPTVVEFINRYPLNP